jgi:hypothetical protein
VAATPPVLVFPPTGPLSRADAIVMFDGVGDRRDATYRLARAGYAPVVAISTQVPGECRATLPAIPGTQLFCFVPAPATTQGEAEALGRMAVQYHWTRVIVVVDTAQATRARIRVDRCYHGQLLLAPVSPGAAAWPKTIAYEWGAMVKALVLQRSC